MWQLIVDFFTVKSFFVRCLRVAVVVAGAGIASGEIPVPIGYEWVGYVLAALGAAITGQPDNSEDERDDGWT